MQEGFGLPKVPKFYKIQEQNDIFSFMSLHTSVRTVGIVLGVMLLGGIGGVLVNNYAMPRPFGRMRGHAIEKRYAFKPICFIRRMSLRHK